MFSLVIPVYRNEASLPELLGELVKLAATLPGPLEVVLVIDGSPDNSWSWLRERLAG
jgi:polyisoprenyl-phosphate glycosyltransferase